MKLFIHLKNAKKDTKAIKEALKGFDGSVVVENGQVVIITSSLVVGDIDLLNSNYIWEAWLRITEFINIINGAAIVVGAILSHISLLKVAYEDPEGKQHTLDNVGKMDGFSPGLRTDTPDISKIIPLALKDKAVAKALRLSTWELDFVNLCRIHEVMQEDAGGLSGGEFDALTGSANNSSVAGDFARHGKIESGTPSKTITLSEAQHLIKRTMREWIHNKVNR